MCRRKLDSHLSVTRHNVKQRPKCEPWNNEIIEDSAKYPRKEAFVSPKSTVNKIKARQTELRFAEKLPHCDVMSYRTGESIYELCICKVVLSRRDMKLQTQQQVLITWSPNRQ